MQNAFLLRNGANCVDCAVFLLSSRRKVRILGGRRVLGLGRTNDVKTIRRECAGETCIQVSREDVQIGRLRFEIVPTPYSRTFWLQQLVIGSDEMIRIQRLQLQ